MRRRVVGTETEYGLMAATAEGGVSSMDVEHVAAQLFTPFLRAGRSSNPFLRNGGRLYLDVGAHPGYATAECDRLGDLLEQDRVGSLILAELALEADEAFEGLGQPERLYLFRNNLDSQGNSCGCHENYLLHRRRDFRQVADAFVSFFMTRQILVGNGKIRHSASGVALNSSQRAEQMWDMVSSAMTRSRLIINTRDEPLADSGSYRRMHVIVGNMSVAEPTSALKIGMTGLLLQAVEDGLVIEDLALADPIRAICEISVDLSDSTRTGLANDRWAIPIEIQKTIRECVLDPIDPDSVDEMHLYFVDLWGRDLDAVSGGDWSAVGTELDIAIKRKLLSTYATKIGTTLTDPRVARLELLYHGVAAQGLLPKLEGTSLAKRLTCPEGVRRAITMPPQTTRACLRGTIIGAAEDARADASVDWVHVRLDDHVTPPFFPQDPLASEDPRVDALIEKIYDYTLVLPVRVLLSLIGAIGNV